jgi:hypothetical protein
VVCVELAAQHNEAMRSMALGGLLPFLVNAAMFDGYR